MAYDFCSVIPDWIGAVGWMLTIFPGTISDSGSGKSSARIIDELVGSSISFSCFKLITLKAEHKIFIPKLTGRGPSRSVSIFSTTLLTASSSACCDSWAWISSKVPVSLIISLVTLVVGCWKSSIGSTSESFGSSISYWIKFLWKVH